jgi:hypothetical protein
VFDFRYHALSLVAVFIALAVGLLLGVAIGDAGLVSSAERDIRRSLRADVRRADDRAKSVQSDLDASRRYEREVYPLLVGGQLEGQQIGLVFLGSSSESMRDHIGAALKDTGGSLASVAVVREPLDLSALGGRARDTRYATMGAPDKPDLDLVEAFGFRMGAQYVAPGQLVKRECSEIFGAFNGKLAPLNAVVVVRDQPELDDPDDSVADRFEQGFLQGMRESDVPVVGAESVSTDPSQIPWFEDRDVSSVDNVNQSAGRAALVFALQGAAGAFGVKSTAQALLPDIAGGAPQP